jgi:hypothetical protein
MTNDPDLQPLYDAALADGEPGAWIRRAIESMERNQRPASDDDPPCSCGLPARVVYFTERFGPVSSCR